MSKVHLQLIVKAIEELTFEELLFPKIKENRYELSLGSYCYEFKAAVGRWQNLIIDQEELVITKEGRITGPNAFEFFQALRPLLPLSAVDFSTFIEEMYQTLYFDRQVLKNALPAASLIDMPLTELEKYAPGHPKILLNKGRLGWGEEQAEQFAPEFGSQVQLKGIYVHRSLAKWEGVLPSEFDLPEKQDYVICPVHPWQWQRYLAIQYADYIDQELMIPTDATGPSRLPQMSLRTLSQVSDPTKDDIKLSLSILNTSCIRGIPEKYLLQGSKLGQAVEDLCQGDSFLENVRVLKQTGGICVPHPSYDALEDAPYWTKEMMGCLWRESASSKLRPGERAYPVAHLCCELPGGNLLPELIRRSGVSLEEWMDLYTQKVILPLYHLQLVHGLGLVAHGQNLILVTENHLPKALIIKDFHGDLRRHGDRGEVFSVIEELPKEHLIHDLITGHFITVLRPMGKILVKEGLSEEKVHRAISRRVESYLKRYGSFVACDEQNILRKHVEKILINRVRFECGYTPGASRLKPLLGGELVNPLYPGSFL